MLSRTFLALLLTSVVSATTSAKRGLVFVPNETYPEDNQIWIESGSDLTWYYNYKASPSPVYVLLPQTQFEFVPMLWGSIDDTSFLTTVKGLISAGTNISHVLTFNEPDGPTKYGGSDITPSKAADVWVKNVAPLREMGIKVGLPACTAGTGGIPWLQQFLSNCSSLISTDGDTKNCSYDFVPLHWYGDFGGLASHMGQYAATFPNVSQWITEYNYDNQDLSTTQDFFNMSMEYFDRLDSVDRYSYFGSFRSKASNVGENAVMLSNDGKLTDIGSWYLGGKATGVSPTSGSAVRPGTPATVGMLAAIVVTAAILGL